MYTDFEIVWQSPHNISVSSTKDGVPMYCVASRHENCKYSWHKFGDKDQKYPSTPLLYVTEAGLYQCTVTFGCEKRRGAVITVKVIAGLTSNFGLWYFITLYIDVYIYNDIIIRFTMGIGHCC